VLATFVWAVYWKGRELTLERLRKRRMIDRVIVGVVIACLAIAVVRATLATVDVLFVLYAARRDAAAAKSAKVVAPALPISERFAASWPFGSWWGRRRGPRIAGGDYLQVVSTKSTARTLGVVVGAIGRQLRHEGVPVKRMLLPSDRKRLYGRPPGVRFTRADGTRFRNSWPTPAQEASLFSDISVVTSDYDPVITAAQVKTLSARTKLTRRTAGVFVGAPVPGGSGTWILLARKGKPRQYYLVPIELSPVGEAV